MPSAMPPAPSVRVRDGMPPDPTTDRMRATRAPAIVATRADNLRD